MPDEHEYAEGVLDQVSIIDRMTHRQVSMLHQSLRLRLALTLGLSEGERIYDGAKDAAVDFLTNLGHTPGRMGEEFDFIAQAMLECVFLRNPSLMGPDGTEPSEPTEAGLPRRNKAQGQQDITDQIRRERMVGFEVGDHTKRPSSPDGWQPGGR